MTITPPTVRPEVKTAAKLYADLPREFADYMHALDYG